MWSHVVSDTRVRHMYRTKYICFLCNFQNLLHVMSWRASDGCSCPVQHSLKITRLLTSNKITRLWLVSTVISIWILFLKKMKICIVSLQFGILSDILLGLSTYVSFSDGFHFYLSFEATVYNGVCGSYLALHYVGVIYRFYPL